MRKMLFWALFTALTASPGLANEPVFVGAAQSHIQEILPPPPAGDFGQAQSELNELHKLEASRTPAEIERAKWDDEHEGMIIFEGVLGVKFADKTLPLTGALSAHVHNDESVNINAAKSGFHRPRPYTFDKSLKPVCKIKSNDDAYPSGHAATGYLEALTLIELVPEKRDAILRRADEYAEDRLICGVHYRSDIEASRLRPMPSMRS